MSGAEYSEQKQTFAITVYKTAAVMPLKNNACHIHAQYHQLIGLVI